MFEMDARLLQDTQLLGDFPLSRVLLMNDSRYPWVILVPRIAGASEVFSLTAEQQQQLWQETNIVAQMLNNLLQADKINIATLGNVVEQLHMHIVLRRRTDAAWPGPVWGHGSAEPYTKEALENRATALKNALAAYFQDDNKVEL